MDIDFKDGSSPGPIVNRFTCSPVPLILHLFTSRSSKRSKKKMATRNWIEYIIFYEDYQIVSTNVKDLLGMWLERNRKSREEKMSLEKCRSRAKRKEEREEQEEPEAGRELNSSKEAGKTLLRRWDVKQRMMELSACSEANFGRSDARSGGPCLFSRSHKNRSLLRRRRHARVGQPTICQHLPVAAILAGAAKNRACNS